MNEQIARKLVPLVNSSNEKLLVTYAEYRLDTLRKKLETAPLEEVHRIQGMIMEVKRLFTLKEEVHKEKTYVAQLKG